MMYEARLLGNHIIVLVTIGCVSTAAGFFGSKTMVLPRSPSINAARHLVGWQDQINRANAPDRYWSLAITPAYERTMGGSLNNYLLNDVTKMTFSGSLAPNRGAHDILADYFGLPLDFVSCVSMAPVISNFIMDFDFYYGLERVTPGLYFELYAPIVQANWNLDMEEKIINAGSLGFPAGYMAATDVPFNQFSVDSVITAFQGFTTWGDMKQPLKYGTIYGREEKVQICDPQVIIGYNFLRHDKYLLGANVRAYLPVGNRINQRYLFNPIVGDAHRWQLGFGIDGHATLWHDEASHMKALVYLEANITHIFGGKQLRSYDFKSSHGSRYMLLETVASSSQQLLINGAPALQQYVGELLPAINATTLRSKVKINVQADIALKLALVYKQFTVDLGYEFWGRSKEKLVDRHCFPDNLYAFKGDAQVYGFTSSSMAVALNATEHNATLHGGQGNGNFVSGSQLQNLNVDNPVVAQTSGGNLTNITAADAASFGFTQANAHTSSPAILLTDADIDNHSPLASHAISNKIFLHGNYTWKSTDYVPYMGIGVEAEFAAHTCKQHNSALSQWGVWLKGGFSH